MSKFNREQVIEFLHAFDRALHHDLKLFIVGGTAAIVEYHASVPTADMDVKEVMAGDPDEIDVAEDEAVQATGLRFYIGGASVAELPYNYEDRVKEVRGVKFSKLTLVVPGKYDLVLSKAIRAWTHDLEAIKSIHEHHPLSETTLVELFENEIWKLATTDPRNFAINMVDVITTLYGKKRAAYYAKRWLAR